MNALDFNRMESMYESQLDEGARVVVGQTDGLEYIGHESALHGHTRALARFFRSHSLWLRKILRELYSLPARIKILRDNKYYRRGIAWHLHAVTCPNGHRYWSKESRFRIECIQALNSIYPAATQVDEYLLQEVLRAVGTLSAHNTDLCSQCKGNSNQERLP